MGFAVPFDAASLFTTANVHAALVALAVAGTLLLLRLIYRR